MSDFAITDEQLEQIDAVAELYVRRQGLPDEVDIESGPLFGPDIDALDLSEALLEGTMSVDEYELVLDVLSGRYLPDPTAELRSSQAARKAWLKRQRSKRAERQAARSEQVAARRADLAASVAALPPGDRQARIDLLEGLMRSGASTADEFRDDSGNFTAARTAQHHAIVRAMLDEKRNVPRDGEAVVLGGLPGSGKGGVLRNEKVEVNEGRFVKVDPDEVKQRMLDAGMMERIPGLTDGEHAALLHEESGVIADLLTKQTMRRRQNILLDRTMASDQRAKIGELRDRGYSDIHVVYADVDVDESVRSAMTRWEEGGRFVPESYIRSSDVGPGRVKNRDNFLAATEVADRWTIVDQTGIAGRQPRGTVQSGFGRAELTIIDGVLDDGTRVPLVAVFGVVDDDALVGEFDAFDPEEITFAVADLADYLDAALVFDVDVDGWVGQLAIGDRVIELARSNMPSQLRRYWLTGPGASEIGWGTTGSFRRCVAALDGKVASPEGTCANLYRDATGRWPGQKKAKMSLAVELNRDVPQLAAAVRAGREVTIDGADLAQLLDAFTGDVDRVDLTRVTVDGFPQLFGAVARNQISRDQMPQIDPGHIDAFRAVLADRGIMSRLMEVDARDLRATQNQLDGRKAGQMLGRVRTHRLDSAEVPPMIGTDGRLLDGHHRWAAEVAYAFERVAAGERAPTMTVVAVEAPMSTLLPLAREFAASEGIQAKAYSAAVFAADRSEAARKAWLKRKAAAESAPVASAESKLSNGLPGPAELAGMKQRSGPLGSQGGKWYEDSSGQRYLVKPAQSREHAMNELSASMFYQSAGVPVDQTGIHESGGKWFIAKRAVQNSDGSLGKQVGMNPSAELQAQAREGFAADAVASSWDAFGLNGDNVITTDDGVMHRIDVGGSFTKRAMGADKPSFNPGVEWTEPMSLRSSNQGRRLYGDMSDVEAAARIESFASSFDVAGFDRQLRDTGIDAPVRERIVSTIADRLQVQAPALVAELRSGT